MYNPKWIPAVTALILKIKRTGRPVLAALLVGVLLSLGFGSAKAAGEGSAASAWHQTDQSALRLIAATETTGDADTLILGLHFKLKPGWKIYWRSPGDAGFPPQPEWKGSENLKHAVIHWPAPERFSKACTGFCRARPCKSEAAALPTVSAAKPCLKAAPSRFPHRRHCSGLTRCCRTASTSTNVRTFLTACFFRAASILRPYWR